MDNKQYALAYPLLNELENKFRNPGAANEINIKLDVDYNFIVAGLYLNKESAAIAAIHFIENVNNQERNSSMSYYLGHFYFINNDFNSAINYFAKAGIGNLENEEIAQWKFEMAYANFYLKDYEKAKPLFNEIHQLTDNKYYLQANYYYGFIAYREKDYASALNSFKIVESMPEYNGIVPYYIAEIYYFQNNTSEALNYALKGLDNPNFYYKKELQLLAGQIYFENKNYQKALPYLESYVAAADKITKEVLYELSFCYYSMNINEKAIAGFKQLSTQNDSLGQNSMYLLGDLYLRANDRQNARNAFQFSANNSSNLQQQEISIFNYAKLSYELKFADIALKEIRKFIITYPSSTYLPEAKEILINLLGNSNNFKEALLVYASIDHPGPLAQKIYPKLLFGRATEFMNEQHFNDAEELFKKIISTAAAPEIPYANFWLGEIAYRSDHYDDAIAYINKYLLKGGIQGEANRNTANYVLGYSYLKKQNYRQALTYFRQVTTSVSPSALSIEQDAYLRTADCYFMLKEYNSAKSMYDNIISIGISSSDYAIFQNALIAGINNPDEKIRQLIILETKYPNSDLIADGNIEIANTYMAQEKFKEAVPYLTRIISGSSAANKPRALLKLGLAWYNLNDNTTALTNYQKLMADYPQSPESDLALENMKAIYVDQGKPEEYIAALKKAGKMITTTEADSLTFNAAELKYNNGDCTTSVTALNNYIEHYPAGSFYILANYERSECYYKIKEWKNAAAGYEIVANSNNKIAEKATLQLARLLYIDLQNYHDAGKYFEKLKQMASTPENQLEALRGLVRTYYQTKDYTLAGNVAKELLTRKNISTDDRAVANLVLGKALESAKHYEEALIAFKLVSTINKLVWGAEARYEIAYCYFSLNNLPLAEKLAMEVIKVNGSSDLWIARSYILLGDIYMLQKDYFNAKATYQSVATNATIPEIKTEAQQKLDIAISTEKSNSKLSQ